MPSTQPLSLVLSACLAVTACDYQLDTQRHPDPRGSLGEEVFRIISKDLDRHQPGKGQAFSGQRERFVRAVDGLMPAAQLTALQGFLVETLPLYDDLTLPLVLRATACDLQHDLALDADLLQAAWYLRRPEGYGPDTVALELARRLARRPDSPELLHELADLWLEHDGLDASLRPSDENDTFAALLSDSSRWLAGRQVDPIDPRSGFATWRDFLLSEDPRLAAGGQLPEHLVRVDQRGRAMVAPDSVSGQIPAPFTDRDHDGLADVDPLSGDYLDADDRPIDAPAPFSVFGERPTVAGRLVYRYSDLTLTPLSAALAQLEPLIADGLMWELPDCLPALLGPIAALADSDGLYAGHDPDDSALFALAHAVLRLADYPRLPQLLEAALTLAELHEPQLARLLNEADRVAEVLDRYPQLGLREHNRLLDDLVGHLVGMARRGYLLRVLETFGQAGWRQLGPGLIEMIRYRSVVPAGWNYYDDYDTQAHYLQIRRPMDWTASDAIYANRSNLQRGVHLIHDTNQVRHSVSVAGWEPFPIPDMLAFYLDSTAGLIQVAWYVAAAVLEFSDETPTTEEVNRFMVNDHDILGNPVGREGFEVRKYNAEALMAMEFSGLLAGLRPLWSTLVQLDRGLNPSGTRILADLLSAVHPHYSCNLPTAAPACADIRPLEPILLEVVEQTGIVDALVDLLASLQGRQTPSGYWVLGELDGFLRHLLEPDPGITRHDGSSSVLANDGISPIAPISRLYLLLDALRAARDAVQADPRAEAAFDRVSALLWDRFLQVEQQAGTFRLKNRQAWTLLLDLLDHLRARARVHLDAGSLSAEIDEIIADLREVLSGRVLPRLVQAWALLAAHPTLPARLDGLALDLINQSEPDEASESRRLAAWALQHLQVDRASVPIGRAAGRLIDPDGQGWRFDPTTGCVPVPPAFETRIRLRWLGRGLVLLRALLDVRANDEAGQPRQVASDLLVNLVRAYPGSTVDPLEDLLEVLSAVQRGDPTATGELSAQDLACVLDQVGDYLLDDERGLEKLYQMIDRRDGF